MKKCPFCSETIDEDCEICDYCGENIGDIKQKNLLKNDEHFIIKVPKGGSKIGKIVRYILSIFFLVIGTIGSLDSYGDPSLLHTLLIIFGGIGLYVATIIK